MALPTSRNRTYAALSQIFSTDLNDIQDRIIAFNAWLKGITGQALTLIGAAGNTLTVTGGTGDGHAVVGTANGTGYGVRGIGASGVGVQGESNNCGMVALNTSTSSAAQLAFGDNGIIATGKGSSPGGTFVAGSGGGTVPAKLDQQGTVHGHFSFTLLASPPSAPVLGEVYVDTSAIMWICTNAAGPVWTKVGLQS